MTTITLDDELIHQVITASHIQDKQQAVVRILADYVQQHKKESSLFEQLRLADDCTDDVLAVVFERNKEIDILKNLPELPCFSNRDPLQLQKALRDEWN
jgi:Arc/MetJ family transcription regulator